MPVDVTLLFADRLDAMKSISLLSLFTVGSLQFVLYSGATGTGGHDGKINGANERRDQSLEDYYKGIQNLHFNGFEGHHMHFKEREPLNVYADADVPDLNP